MNIQVSAILYYFFKTLLLLDDYISPANTSLKHNLQLVEYGLYLVEVKLKYSSFKEI
jgi:hypothetical protein